MLDGKQHTEIKPFSWQVHATFIIGCVPSPLLSQWFWHSHMATGTEPKPRVAATRALVLRCIRLFRGVHMTGET